MDREAHHAGRTARREHSADDRRVAGGGTARARRRRRDRRPVARARRCAGPRQRAVVAAQGGDRGAGREHVSAVRRSALARARSPRIADAMASRMSSPFVRASLVAAMLAGAAVIAPDAVAQSNDLPLFSSRPAAGGGQSYSLPVETLLLLTALTFLPAVLL